MSQFLKCISRREERGERRLAGGAMSEDAQVYPFAEVFSAPVTYKRGVTHNWNIQTMAGAGLYKWTDDETLTLIRLRAENDHLFTGKRHTAKKAWEEILQKMALAGVVTPTQVAKKWDNLKRKYKELRCPATGTGTDRGEATAAMHEAIGGRPSIDPPIVMDSAETSASVDAVVSGGGSTSTEAAQSQETVEDEEATESGSDSHMEDVEPSTSAGLPPRKKRRRSQVLQFLEEEAAKEEERFNRHHQAMQQNTTRFLDLFEELVKKN